MNLLRFIYFICGTAFLPLLHFSAKGFQVLLSVRNRRQSGIEAKARILHVEMMNERSRRVPFARLKVEVFTRNGEPFIADAEGFYSHDELQAVKKGAIVYVRYQPYDKGQLQLIKKPSEMAKASRLFVKEGGEIIAIKRGLTQTPEARHRRLVSQ